MFQEYFLFQIIYPHKPNPPTIILFPDSILYIASLAEFTTLFIDENSFKFFKKFFFISLQTFIYILNF
jgi:hypothetical protein